MKTYIWPAVLHKAAINAPSVQRRKVWLTPTAGVPCSNAAKKYLLKFAGVPQTTGPISAASYGPMFTILWEHLEKILLHNVFSGCRYMPYLLRHSPTKLYDGAQTAIFASCIFSEPRAARC